MANDLAVVQSNTPAAAAPAPYANGVSAGLQNTTSMSGSIGRPAVLMETNDVSTIQRVIKFKINNVGTQQAPASAVKLRIGSMAARPDAYQRFGLDESAADNTVIKDDVGVGCKKVQAFSEYVCFVPVWTKTIKIFCDDTTQLTESLVYRQLMIDGATPSQRIIDLAFTQKTSDQRQNLIEGNISLLLDATRYFEYGIDAGVSVTIFLELGAISNSETFTSFPGASISQ